MPADLDFFAAVDLMTPCTWNFFSCDAVPAHFKELQGPHNSCKFMTLSTKLDFVQKLDKL